MKKVIEGKIYNTETAEAIADNEFSDGTNRMSHGRCLTLYKTKKGAFFVEHETCWEGERDTIEPVTMEQAKDYYESMKNEKVSWAGAFGQEPEEA